MKKVIVIKKNENSGLVVGDTYEVKFAHKSESIELVVDKFGGYHSLKKLLDDGVVEVVHAEINNNFDNDISYSPRSCEGLIHMVVDNKSIGFEFEADTVEDYSPAEYEDGYLVWDEEIEIRQATITSLKVNDAYLLDGDGDETESIKFSVEDLTAEQKKYVEELIEGEIHGNSEKINLKEFRGSMCPY